MAEVNPVQQASFPEWVEHGHVEALKIPDVTRNHGKVMQQRARGDHGIFIHRVRLPMHEFGPQPKSRGIHGQNIIGTGDLIRPSLDCICFKCILFASDFNAGLYFA